MVELTIYELAKSKVTIMKNDSVFKKVFELTMKRKCISRGDRLL